MEDLREIYGKMETEELVRIVTVESCDYQESFLRIAMDELKKRGVEIEQEKQFVGESEDMAGSFVDLYAPRDEIDLVFLKSIFDAEKIEYFVRGGMFGSMRTGPPVPMYNERTFMVSTGQLERAKELLQDYLDVVGTVHDSKVASSKDDALRLIAELFLFGWCVPGRRNFELDDDEVE